MTLTQEPRLLANITCEIGEGPLWHPDEGVLFFLDIAGGATYAYTPATGECRLFSQGPETGGMTLQEDGTLLLFQDTRISALGMDGVQRQVATGLCGGNDRFNDVVADPEGRVFAGTMDTKGPPGKGRLFRFDPDGTITELLNGLGIPNGMGFTPDGKQLYFTDSLPGHIHLFDYDRRSGSLSNRRIFAHVQQNDGYPDGLAVDAESCVWTALWFGGGVRRYSSDGSLNGDFPLPVRQVSAIAFGGSDLGDIYVTTGSSKGADALLPAGHDISAPRGGGFYGFRIPGLSGRPHFRSRLKF